MAPADDPEFDALLGPAPAGGAPAMATPPPPSDDGHGVPDPTFDALLNSSAPSSPAHAAAPPARAPSKPHAQTRFQASAAPSPANEPEPTWPQVGQQALHNAIPSAIGVGQSLLDAVAHPIQTAKNIGQLGAGALSQAQGALGFTQDPAQKAKTEGLVKALEDHYSKTYLSGAKGLKKAIATDPASVLVDASSLIDPAAGVIGKLGEAGKLGALSGAAVTASRALPYVNPIKSAVAIARAPGKVASAVGRGIGSVTSGVPETALKIATEVGSSGDPAVQQAFSRFATGQGNATEFADQAHAAMGQIRDDASQAYLSGKAPLLDKPVDLSGTYAALDKADADVAKGSPLGFQDAKDRLAQIRSLVDSVANNPDPAARNLDNVDTLKQQIYDLHSGSQAGKAGAVTNNIYHGVKSDLVNADPVYAKLMESYTSGLRNTSDLTKTLALNPKAPASATLAKNLKALKTSTGQNLLGQLIQKDPSIGGMLAGAAINPWTQHNSLWEAALGAGLPAVLSHPIGALAAIPGAAAGFALSSPRIIGSAANLAGQASRPLSAISSPLGQGVAKGAYYAGRADQQTQTDAEPPNGPSTPVFSRMLKQESGNRQFDAKGNTIVSPKGAIGAAQIMPETGPQAAQLAGQEWDLDRLKTDPDYNKALGQAYHDHLSEMFGNPIIGAAAYNAGPERVQEALNMAEQTGRSWIDYLPQETQKYVAALQGGAASGGRIQLATGGKAARQTHEQLVERLMKMARAAKIKSNQATKPLLTVPDDAVVKALGVAQQAI